MAKNPKIKSSDIFDRKIDGVLGRFGTSKSYEVQYLLGSMRLPRAVDYLEIAAEAFPFSGIDFEEMVQRDVDYTRVKKIVTEYLKQGEGRVLFFPPLIVAVVALEKDRPKNLYASVEREYDEADRELKITFDADKFQLQLNVADKPTGYTMLCDKKEMPIYPYAATLAWTSNLVKLVVIDGQHRFDALRILHRTDPELSAPIEVPICLVYTPDATENADSGERILKDLREMFVRINTTAKQVSGHFIELLRDQSLSSITVRELANSWKKSDDVAWRSRLQLLEWNERSDSKSSTCQRIYSVTTISILADVLRTHLFSAASRKDGVPQALLRLGLRQKELEQESDVPRFHQIDDESFASSQEPILRGQIADLIVPALNVLLLEAEPYQEVWNKLQSAVSLVAERSDKDVTGYRVFLEEILGQFRRWEPDKDAPTSKDAQDVFDDIVKLVSAPDVLFLNVFQQGYIRLWMDLSLCLGQIAELAPVECARLLVATFNAFVFPNAARIFAKDQLFTNRVLYINAKPNLSGWGREVWANLCAASLLNPKATEAASKWLGSQATIDGEVREKVLVKLDEMGCRGMEKYRDELKYRVAKDISANWRVKDYDRGLKIHLESLKADGNGEEYDQELLRLTDEAAGEALEQLHAVLKIPLVAT